MKMKQEKFQGLLSATSKGRYRYLLSDFVYTEKIWGLKSPDGWLLLKNNEYDSILPLWPSAEFAEYYKNSDNEKDSVPESIDIDSFLERWLPGLEKDNTQLAIFPLVKLDLPIAVIVSAGRFSLDLKRELGEE